MVVQASSWAGSVRTPTASLGITVSGQPRIASIGPSLSWSTMPWKISVKGPVGTVAPRWSAKAALASVTNASLSRLSHLVKRLEGRGFVRRETDPTDGRYTNAVLTEAGYEHLVASAPAHVATVRQLVIDPFTTTELRQLHTAAERILRGV